MNTRAPFAPISSLLLSVVLVGCSSGDSVTKANLSGTGGGATGGAMGTSGAAGTGGAAGSLGGTGGSKAGAGGSGGSTGGGGGSSGASGTGGTSGTGGGVAGKGGSAAGAGAGGQGAMGGGTGGKSGQAGTGGSGGVGGASGSAGAAGGKAGASGSSGSAGGKAGSSGNGGKAGSAGGGGAAGQGGCAKGTTQCVGLELQTCVGSGVWQDTKACPFACMAGACAGVCVPNDVQCAGNQLQTCGPNATWKTTKTCTSVCMAGSCTGTCVPNTTQCNGDTVQTCDPMTGTFVDAGAPCPYVCSGGACSGDCAPGTTQCTGNVLQKCSPAGAWQNSQACPSVCSNGACAGACVPGTTQCSGTEVQLCDASGVWKPQQSCPFLCTNAACTGVCNPGDKQCTANMPETCDANGAWQSAAACPFVCSAGACAGACTPGALQCDGTELQTCVGGTWQFKEMCPFSCKSGACVGDCAPPGSGQCLSGGTNGGVQTCTAKNQWADVTCFVPTNAVATCDPTSFTCAFDCKPGFADCNLTASDGCEVNLASTSSCGMCGNTCGAAANANPSCAGGMCAFICHGGFADCDADPTNGCEASLKTDAANCNACNNVCPPGPTNTIPSCVAGTCGLACVAGYAHCDGVPTDVCETDTSSDPNNCGACGKGCGAGGVCNLGACIFSSCATARAAQTLPNGVYTIDPDGPGGNAPLQVFCDMTTDGGGWTFFLHVDAGTVGSDFFANDVGTYRADRVADGTTYGIAASVLPFLGHTEMMVTLDSAVPTTASPLAKLVFYQYSVGTTPFSSGPIPCAGLTGSYSYRTALTGAFLTPGGAGCASNVWDPGAASGLSLVSFSGTQKGNFWGKGMAGDATYGHMGWWYVR